MSAGLEVVSSGFLASIQDRGRLGLAHFGISQGGAADLFSFRIGNLLVGNEPFAAAIEMALQGGTFKFLQETWFAVTGAECAVRLGGHRVPLWTSFLAKPGDVLSIGSAEAGARIYLSVGGGINVPLVLNSSSAFVSGNWGGYKNRPLAGGDLLSIKSSSVGRGSNPGYRRARSEIRSFLKSFKRSGFSEYSLRVTKGPQSDLFKPKDYGTFLKTEFTVSADADRKGVRLMGAAVHLENQSEMISEGVSNGAIQIPPNGQPLLLYCEQQTTGGYPKIANVINVDLHLIGQLKPGDRLRFKEVSLEEAWDLAREREALWEYSVLPF